MTDSSGSGVTAHTIVAIWKRRRGLALLVFMLPLAAVVGFVPFLPNIYKTSAILVVERQQVPEAFVKSTITSALETRLATMTQQVLSRSRLVQLIGQFTLYPEMGADTPPEAVLERFRRDIEVELRGVETKVRGGALSAFTVSYSGHDPVTVANVTNAVATFYLEENARVREQQASDTTEFLRRQLDEVKARLSEQEARVSEFKRRYIGETPQQVQGNLSILQRITDQLRLNGDNQGRAMERRESLTRQVAEAQSLGSLFVESSGMGGPMAAPGVDPTEVRLARLRHELTELSTRFSERYPDVVRLKAEIAALERQRGETSTPSKSEAEPPRTPAGPNPFELQLRETLADVELEIKTLKVEEKRLRDDAGTYQRRLENAPKREQEFLELSREYDTTSEHHRTLLRRYDEAQLASDLEQRQKGEQFRILESAIPSRVPSAPNRGRLLALGLAMSAGLALAAVLLAERLDTSFHSVEELRAVTRAPVLARIPVIVSDSDVARRRVRVRAMLAASVLSVLVIGTAAYLTATGRVPVASAFVQSLAVRS